MRRRGTIGVVAILVAAGGCKVRSSGSGETGVRLSPAEAVDVAVGARFDAAVYDECSDAETKVRGYGGKIPSTVVVDFERQTCERSVIESLQTTVDGDSMSVESTEPLGGYGIVRLEATSAGESTVLVDVGTSSGDYELSGQFRAHEVDTVALTAGCGKQGTDFRDARQIVVTQGESVIVEYELRAGETSLAGYDYFPIDVGELEIEESGLRRFRIDPPEAPGTYPITSSADPDLSFELVVAEPGDVDALNLESTEVGCDGRLTFSLSFDGVPTAPCKGWLPVTLTTSTPQACIFAAGIESVTIDSPNVSPDNPAASMLVRSLGAGPCEITASVDGGEVTETTSFEFDRCTPWTPTGTGNAVAFERISPDELVVVTASRGVQLLSGGLVTEVTELEGVPRNLRDATATATDTVFAIDYEELVWWNSGVRDSKEVGRGLAALSKVGDVWWLVGTKAMSFSFDEGLRTWEAPEGLYTDVWMASATSGFAVGSKSTSAPRTFEPKLMRFDGSAWALEQVDFGDFTGKLNGVWGAEPDDVWAVGDGCKIAHWDGTRWTFETLDCDVDLHAVHGTSRMDVVAVGGNGLYATWDGREWQLRWAAEAPRLANVRVEPERIFVSGGNGWGVIER